MAEGATALSPPTWCIFVHHYPAKYGGGVAHWVSVFLEKEGRFDTGLAELSLTFVQLGPYVPSFVGGGVVVRDGSDGQRANWEVGLARLPKHRFERKARRLAISMRGEPGLDFLDRDYLVNLSAEHLRIGALMVRRALELAQSKFKPSDKVDLTSMIRAAEKLALRDWSSDEAMRAELTIAHEVDRARIDAMDPWAKIDMREFHTGARKILDQPSDWNPFDDFSPHGNDLGADILGGWPKLKNMSVPAVARHFEIDLATDDADASMARIQMWLAIAFGHVKKSGRCPQELALNALQILQNDRAQAAEVVGSEHLAAWERACGRYMALLEKLAVK